MIWKDDLKSQLEIEKNNGWLKKVDGVDKSQRGGYSILGEFIKDSIDFEFENGLYLDCEKKSDYKKNIWRLISFKNGKMTLLEEVVGTKWTNPIHNSIESNLEKDPQKIFDGLKKDFEMLSDDNKIILKEIILNELF